jgi:hypothetical protein
MRPFLVSLATLLCVGLASAAHAERRMFIIVNDTSYGVDNCLAKGDRCGAAAANAYCQSRQFASATSYRKVDRDDITGAIPSGGSGGCSGAHCDDFLAIVCTR